MQILFLILGIALVGLDQWTKQLALKYLSDGSVVECIDGIFDFVYVENRGAAFGMLQDTRWFLVTVTVLLIAILLWYVIRQKSKSPLCLSAVTLIIAGGIGNLIDRVANGFVVDFIHLLFMEFPCFNVADICVCIGTGLLALYILISPETKRSDDDGGNH